ncbi:hypothetical protein ACFL04_00050 [Patescibacteria group bacterium]
MVVLIGFISLTVLDYIQIKDRKKHNVKLSIIVFTIILLFAVGIGGRIDFRQSNNLQHTIHDGALQTEVAADLLRQGKNPYHENFSNTVLGQVYGKDNVIMEHYIYLPFYLLTSSAVQSVNNALWDNYDQRILLLLAFFVSLVIMYKIPSKLDTKLLAVTIFAFNPIFIRNFIFGHNEIFVFVLILGSIYLLSKKHFGWSLVVIGLALASKQLAWPILPFYFLYLYMNIDQTQKLTTSRFLVTLKKLWPTVLVFLAVIMPFVIWSPVDFFNDVYRYPTGGLATSFPIQGVGFSQLMLSSGLIKSATAYFPFWIIQIIIGLSLMWWLLKKQVLNNNISFLLTSYMLLALAVLMFGRYFNEPFIAYFSMLAIAAWAFKDNAGSMETEPQQTP